MLVCRRCTTENADGALKCSYCAETLGAPPVSSEPAWGIQPYAYPGYLELPSAARRGSKLFLPHGSALPDRCVKCNAPAGGFRLSQRLTYLPPAYLLFLIFGVLPYAIVGAIASKHADVSLGLCVRHRRDRARAIAAGVSLGGLGTALVGLAIFVESGALGAAGMAVALVGGIGAVRLARPVVAKNIDTTGVWLSGVDREYLNELPAGPPDD